MKRTLSLYRISALAAALITSAGCSYHGVNSLPLPGAVGRGSGAQIYHVQIANVGTLESNSPVMIDDVVVGTVEDMNVVDGHADITVSVRQGITVAGNAVATIGQTSLLGSSHLALDPPPGHPPAGHLAAGSTLELNAASTYPSTEQTLASVSALVNAGGLGQIGDIFHSLNTALSGHQGQVRDLLKRLDRLVGIFDAQRDDVVAVLHHLDRVAGTVNSQRDVLTRALRALPGALDVLVTEQPRFTTALQKLGVFSGTATTVINQTQADLVTNLTHLEPTLRALADVGPDLDTGLAFLSSYPLTQDLVDRAVRGDYINFFPVLDLTVNRLKRGALLGTRWGQEGLTLVPAPGDPGYEAYYTDNPLGVGVAPVPDPPAPVPPPPVGGGG